MHFLSQEQMPLPLSCCPHGPWPWVPAPLHHPFLQEAPRGPGEHMKHSEVGLGVPEGSSLWGLHPQGLGGLAGQLLPLPSCPGWQ